jgi:NADPH:quinone reductase-like Zn-dependent oxidoreductase
MQTVIQYSRFGGPDVLEVAENPDPVPGEGKVLIDVKAVGVNPIDWKLRQGIRPSDAIEKPRRLGSDAAGVIAALGPGVDAAGWAAGDEVVVSGASGAYASKLVASIGKLLRKPAGVPFEQAAALGVPAGTAYQAVVSLGPEDGDVLLIHGASGAVGQAAIQFARARDVVVIGTASHRNLARLRELDAIALEYGDGLVERVRQVVPEVDYVLDLAGTDAALEASFDLVADRSHIGTIVAGARAAELGIQAWSGGSPVPLTDEQQRLRADGVAAALEGLADHTFQVEIGLVLPLADAAEAHRLSQANEVRGKIVLVP